MSISDNIRARLRSQVSRGEPILFIGAGFSVAAQDMTGCELPSSKSLCRELAAIAFPGASFDERTRLGDAFFAAKQTSATTTAKHLRSRLSVNSDTIPDFYETWFSIPWFRCYSLNLDDLEQAVARKWKLKRNILSKSATSNLTQGRQTSNDLEVIHLNGAIWDKLDDMTFSAFDYGGRLAAPDQYWINCVADMISRPVVFVGTELDESPLWQYMQYRLNKGPRGITELRPGSYLVCPELNPARQKILKELHIEWVPMTAKEFQESVLSDFSVESGLGHDQLRAKLDSKLRRTVPRLVSELVGESSSSRTEYLMGQEPQWADLTSGRAIERENDTDLFDIAKAILEGRLSPRPLILTGTAGSGKSTGLMRLALECVAMGLPTFWADEQSNFQPHGLTHLVKNTKGPIAILLDDADLWGSVLTGWARELPQLRSEVLFACALRSTKIEGLVDKNTLGGLETSEVVMPHLTDSDIESLIAILDKENRLGVLKGKAHDQRVEAFRREAGRQLLVAMIQATSGKLFEERALEEFSELSSLPKQIYAIICFVSSQRFTLDREEILLACGKADNETLNELETLVRRNVIFRKELLAGYTARHRVIADTIVHAPTYQPFIGPVLEGVCFAFANRISPTEPRTTRNWRRLIRFINHEFILQMVSLEDGRHVYERLEQILHWDHHYWLQRGGLEVHEGDISFATNFLEQSLSLAPDDHYVKTEWYYLLLKKAVQFPFNANAHDWFDEGYDGLLGQIAERGNSDPYPYHVLGSQALAWMRVANLSIDEKKTILSEALKVVKVGAKKHFRSDELRKLSKDLESEWLLTSISM